MISGSVRRMCLGVTFLDETTYRSIELAVPIVCTDIVPVRRDTNRAITHMGLITRLDRDGIVKGAHLGGRIRRGETTRQAIIRHLDESLTGYRIDLAWDIQPVAVQQFMPPHLAPIDGTPHGIDTDKHAVSLVYAIDMGGDPQVVPGGEALTFDWVGIHAFPANLWAGVEFSLHKVAQSSGA